MPQGKNDAAYLWDMLEASKAAMNYANGRTFAEYLEDDFLRAAIERKVEIIGEAARNISAEFRSRHQQVPWRAIMAQRHVLAHDYDEIQHENIWRVVTIHLASLIAQLHELLPPLPPDPEPNP